MKVLDLIFWCIQISFSFRMRHLTHFDIGSQSQCSVWTWILQTPQIQTPKQACWRGGLAKQMQHEKACCFFSPYLILSAPLPLSPNQSKSHPHPLIMNTTHNAQGTKCSQCTHSSAQAAPKSKQILPPPLPTVMWLNGRPKAFLPPRTNNRGLDVWEDFIIGLPIKNSSQHHLHQKVS